MRIYVLFLVALIFISCGLTSVENDKREKEQEALERKRKYQEFWQRQCPCSNKFHM